MAARTRRVIWTVSARDALDDVITYIAQDSKDAAARILVYALDSAASLSTMAERGRIVPELADSNLRELFVFDYRLLYRVHDDRVVIRGFLHGAQDFSKWRQKRDPEL